MQYIKKNSDIILLFPPSLTKDDIVEIVKWQNELKLPVIAQLKSQVQLGILGGAVMDTEKISDKFSEYLDKLLTGRKPSQLPNYYIGEKYAINLKSSSILELKIPLEIIEQAEILR